MKKKLPALVLLLFFPLLLANSPSPYPNPDIYQDYLATPLVKSSEGDKFTYTTTITNTGDNYISVNSTTLINEEEDIWVYYSSKVDDVILPSASYELKFTTREEFDPAKTVLRVEAFVELSDEYTYQNITNLRRRDKTENDDYYLYEYDVDINVETKNYYGIITVYDYDGQTYAGYNKFGLDDPLFLSDEAMEVEDITITDVILVQGRTRSNGGTGILLVFIMLIAPVMLILGVILTIALLIGLTIFLIKRHKDKKNIKSDT